MNLFSDLDQQTADTMIKLAILGGIVLLIGVVLAYADHRKAGRVYGVGVACLVLGTMCMILPLGQLAYMKPRSGLLCAVVLVALGIDNGRQWKASEHSNFKEERRHNALLASILGIAGAVCTVVALFYWRFNPWLAVFIAEATFLIAIGHIGDSKNRVR